MPQDRSQRVSTAVERIRRALGPAGCLADADLIAPYLVDFRGLYRGATPLVARPASTAEVSEVLAICHELGVGVVPHGGNTSYCGGATPSAAGDEIVLSLARTNRIRALDGPNFTITVEAGCILADVKSAAEAADRFFPLSLGSEGSCQIGGNLSTNAGGLNALRYGVARDLVLGLEVVLADGRVIDGLTSLRKDNTGYDLRDLFVGAEGTLGVITAASLKLFPATRSVETAFVAVPGPAAAVALLGRLRAASGEAVSSFEYLPRIAVELTVQHVPGVTDPLGHHYDGYVLCELSSSREDGGLRPVLEATLGRAMTEGLALDATIAESLVQRSALWRLRESVPESQRAEGASIKHDVSVPVASPARVHGRGDSRRPRDRPDGAHGRLRTCRRRQPAFQRERTRRWRPRGIPVAGTGHPVRRVRNCPTIPRQHQRRARHRAPEARAARGARGSGGDRRDARHQAGAGPQGHHEPGEGAARQVNPGTAEGIGPRPGHPAGRLAAMTDRPCSRPARLARLTAGRLH